MAIFIGSVWIFGIGFLEIEMEHGFLGNYEGALFSSFVCFGLVWIFRDCFLLEGGRMEHGF
jgi:hypothetical protein